MAFFGRYVEEKPHYRLVRTNDKGKYEGAETTGNFEERGGSTVLVITDLYLSKEALDATGSTGGMRETLEQLDVFVVFFFSSRRRHTRYWRDWSSDVCSSDLRATGLFGRRRPSRPSL